MKITFSAKVYASVHKQLNKEIMTAVTGSPEMKKELNRVFQQANRRVQNVTSAGTISPAVEALREQGREIPDNGRFKTVFSVAGLDLSNQSQWQMAQQEYAEAMAFLNQPTSTATGAKQFVRQVAAKNDIEVEDANDILVGIYSNEGLKQEANSRGDKYRYLVDDVIETVKEAQSGMAQDAREYAQEMRNQLRQEVDRVTQNTMDLINGFAENFTNSPRIH